MFVQYVLVSTPAISRIYVEPKISKISRKSKCTGKDIDWSFHQRKWMIHHLCLEDSGSYKNGCGSKATGFTPKELTIETPAGAILGHDSWRVSPFFVDLVPFVSVSCPSRPQPTWGTLPWPTSWAKGAPWLQHHFLASPQRWNTSSSSWWSSPPWGWNNMEQPRTQPPKYTDGFKPTGNIIASYVGDHHLYRSQNIFDTTQCMGNDCDEKSWWAKIPRVFFGSKSVTWPAKWAAWVNYLTTHGPTYSCVIIANGGFLK